MISLLDDDFTALNGFVKQARPTRIFLLCDENTHEHCAPLLLANLESEVALEILEIPAGEENKDIGTSIQLWEVLAEFRADRRSLIINLGGGVITDIGGFVASTYKRGIPFVNVPTTLLGMCDASVGGKTGIDHRNLKNLVGTFAEAVEIFLYTDFLDTLPKREIRSGFAEMLKHGLALDAAHWAELGTLQDISAASIKPFISGSMALKQKVVIEDFYEKNVRKKLNFGHTVGHALESLFLKTGNPITHGEAVVLGMICETKLSALENLIDSEIAENIIIKLKTLYPDLSPVEFTDEEIFRLMVNDKKNENSAINFTLLTAIGASVFDHQCSSSNVILALEFLRGSK